MSKVSVLIPARNEPHLERTVSGLFANAQDEIEVIVVLDGVETAFPIPDHNQKQVKVIGLKPRGMRASIEEAAANSTGEYLLKTDAHCAFGPCYDAILKADCDDNWIVVPRRYSLDVDRWVRKDKAPIDYHYLSYPYGQEDGLHGRPWTERAKERAAIDIDDEMSSQGSCWFMSRKHWHNIGGMPELGYGKFTAEFQQLGLVTWLGGGRVVTNSRTWYAHWHKSGSRGYHLSKRETDQGTRWCSDYWMHNRWTARKYDMRWLIEKFWPVPTWPTKSDGGLDLDELAKLGVNW